MWGFKAISGDRVGGGLFAKVPLEPDEQILANYPCAYSPNHLNMAGGHLILTNKRLIFSGLRNPFTPSSASIPFGQIISCEVRRIFNFTFWIAFARATTVVVPNGRHFFWVSRPMTAARLSAEILERLRPQEEAAASTRSS